MRFIYSIILIVLLPVAVSAVEPGSNRIGYVDFSKAINEVADGKMAKKKLTDEFREKQQQLDRLRTELKETRDDIDRDRLIISPEALAEREDKYQRKFTEFGQRYDSFKKEMAVKEEALTSEILNKLRSIVKELGKNENYALILEKSQDIVLYAPQVNDLTDRVIDAYNKGKGKKK